MSQQNNLNIFRGPDAVRDYFDPDTSPPLPLVELPAPLNPYREHGVRIYAKMMSMHPANNVKCMPALNLLEKAVVPGTTQTVVEYSSGSTVMSMSLIARAIHGLDDTRAFLSNKTSLAKIRLMQLFGINITLFGGPSQPEPLDERGGIRAAQRLGAESVHAINPDQYGNDNNWKAHIRWTGPQIYKQLPEINVICAGMGTSGTMTGLGTYFKGTKPSVFRLGVCTAPGDRVPGPRSHALLGPVNFPWREAIDHFEEVGSYESYRLSLELSRQGLVCGPSSGFNLRGLYQFIERHLAEGTLRSIAGSDGDTHCVFLCCDLPYQYVNEYFDKLDTACFPPITNEELLNVDLYRYDEKWERDGADVLREYFDVNEKEMNDLFQHARKVASCELPALSCAMKAKDDVAIIDLRQPCDFAERSLPGSVSLPVATEGQKSPFFDPSLLSKSWKQLDSVFSDQTEAIHKTIAGKRLLVVCYDGDTARVGASVLRAKGYRADSLRGGLKGLASMISSPKLCETGVSQLPSPTWLQLCEAHREAPHASAQTTTAGAELLNLQHPTVTA